MNEMIVERAACAVLGREKRYRGDEDESDMRDARRREDVCGAELGMRKKRRGGGEFCRRHTASHATVTSDADFVTGLIQSSIEARSVFIVIQHYYL